MTRPKTGFWRGYWPLLMALASAQLAQQADIVMMSRLGGPAAGAYVMMMRLALVEVVLMTAMGAVASTVVAQAQRNGGAAPVIGRILGLALLTGLLCGALGWLLYPTAARWLAGEGDVASLVGEGVFWHALAAPFRFVVNIGAFVLHALGRGPSVVRWKLTEAAAKIAANLLLMDVLGWGFSGCFLSGLIVGALSSIWCRRMLPPGDARLSLPGCSWTLRFLRPIYWEAQRLISVQLAILACFSLFAAPWLANYSVSRMNSFAAGQTLMLMLFTPFVALTRFLAFRHAALRDGRLSASMWRVWAQGAPVVVAAALALLESDELLGRLYGQSGHWWSTLIQALAISLPLRFAANIARALFHSQGSFAMVAAADGAAFWLIATPLVAIGLYVDSPAVAYSSLILPEAACAAWMWGRLGILAFREKGPVGADEGVKALLE
ncbi:MULTISPECIES: MATE family efflux transporter [Methylosinus]|uniref:Multi antimicrobial extrusion protein MatE n=1 Tax=Methylosinus trichosporium (strain ATCC 35070 / NCIMB 11131 / UNIQEM 75 / OB3b) TaxID=595536 RepID=A0A2D2CY63_METT3|nr:MULTISPECIES: MATE family efflux transporter [Methylosinus]ATQ67690.1 multi antimicrobial extrusion protein MatE [Methylosinus trichosporium OB3b]OBS53636.1 multi antimicrobial extrusion protein MatE [Methylosinus sp. 3S-1]